MTGQIFAIFLIAIAAANLIWLVPVNRAMDAMALITVVTIGCFSPETLLWLIAATVLTWALITAADTSVFRNVVAGLIAFILLGGFVAAQFTDNLLWIGASFFTLRLLHITGDWWTRTLNAPGLAQLLRYQFFLPVIVVGPIHRFQTFDRQVARRRWDWENYWSGMERCLTGFFMAHVIGGYLIGNFSVRLDAGLGFSQHFAAVWLLSAAAWIKLYFVFAGLSAVALGSARIAGLQLEENFNQPWRAANLLDFWNRWHMSLTSWSRDYAYTPVMAITRNPLLGVIAAMLVIGLWHSISVYYLLWAFWQASGIFLSRSLSQYVSVAALPIVVRAPMTMLAILGWLSLARPVISVALGVDYDANSSSL